MGLRLSVVVIFLTVAPMHVAWAECAWVLWIKDSISYICLPDTIEPRGPKK